jgi:hypothetical protein
MRYPLALTLSFSLGWCGSAFAQTPTAASLDVARDSPERSRAAPWFEPQTVTLSSRYRFVENSADKVTANQVQFKDAFRARFNVDRGRRFSINVGAFSGSSFISSWDTTGIGSGNPSASLYMKQLYASAAPVHGLELQLGGLYINHGENTDVTSYDDDGYVMGERVTLRRPSMAYFDEVSLTSAGLGSIEMPGVIRRLKLFGHQNYWQAQIIKHVSHVVSASADFTGVSGAETVRAAAAFRLPKAAPVSTVRLELYRRVTMEPASGFAVIAERPVTAHARLQVGYATIDPSYGGLNADRIQRGRRIFGTATIPLTPTLNVQLFATQAFGNDFTVTNHTRFDAVVTYDVLAAIRRQRS